MRFLTKFY